jgi:hypothetical protein
MRRHVGILTLIINIIPSQPILSNLDTFLRNVGSNKIHTVPQPRRRHSSQSLQFKSQILHILTIMVSMCEFIPCGNEELCTFFDDECRYAAYMYTYTHQGITGMASTANMIRNTGPYSYSCDSLHPTKRYRPEEVRHFPQQTFQGPCYQPAVT